MMPVQDAASQPNSQNPQPGMKPDMAMPAPQGPQGDNVNYKKKYKVLKRKMRMLVYEQECFMEELKKAQRKLLKVSRDRSFLLDRLLVHEKLDDTSDDTDITASSDSEADGTKEPSAAKKKKMQQSQLGLSLPPGAPVSLLPGNINKQQASWLLQMSGEKAVKNEPGTKRKPARVGKKGKGGAGAMSADRGGPSGTGHMTREELERHLELKQSAKPQFMSLESTPYSLPEDIFSHDNSNQDGEISDIKREDPSNFIIHMPR